MKFFFPPTSPITYFQNNLPVGTQHGFATPPTKLKSAIGMLAHLATTLNDFWPSALGSGPTMGNWRSGRVENFGRISICVSGWSICVRRRSICVRRSLMYVRKPTLFWRKNGQLNTYRRVGDHLNTIDHFNQTKTISTI